MNIKLIEDIAAAVLYEGYLLYPYRASAVKNRQRWNFGVLYPPAYVKQSGSDASIMQTECLLRAMPEAIPKVRARFLHLTPHISGGQEWQGAMPREVTLAPHALADLDSKKSCRRVMSQREQGQRTIEVIVEVEAIRLGTNLFKLRVIISNVTTCGRVSREQALLQALVSTHTILAIDGGEFVSLLDPPEDLRDLAATCKNSGTWPVLAGEEGRRDCMLSSPIILYDYPKIAPESPGALFDGTEIDEILTLRILTLTDEEKRAMAEGDDRVRQILKRTENLSPEQFMKLHGVFRNLHDAPMEKP